MRMPITRNGATRLFGPLAGMFGFTCWVEVDEHLVRARMGPTCRAEIPRTAIRSVRARGWHWWYGYGARIYGRLRVGFVGSSRGVVELELNEPVELRLVFFRKRCSRFSVSVDEPEALLAALS